MKERSKRSVCNSKNANGNLLDAAIIDQIKALDDNKGSFMEQLEKSRRFYTGNRESYEESLSALRQDKITVEKKMEGLIDSLAELGDSAARSAVAKRIEQLSMEILDIDQRLRELEGLTSQHALSDIEFDVMRQL
jgi:site-specific DNA recombinase